uniref:Tubulin--tyrosine ligase-like protein 9 n=1 Tax=Caenorhabditis japonica TaxID=281687 RepID=A0A8R1I575_CAEJA
MNRRKSRLSRSRGPAIRHSLEPFSSNRRSPSRSSRPSRFSRRRSRSRSGVRRLNRSNRTGSLRGNRPINTRVFSDSEYSARSPSVDFLRPRRSVMRSSSRRSFDGSVYGRSGRSASVSHRSRSSRPSRHRSHSKSARTRGRGHGHSVTYKIVFRSRSRDSRSRSRSRSRRRSHRRSRSRSESAKRSKRQSTRSHQNNAKRKCLMGCTISSEFCSEITNSTSSSKVHPVDTIPTTSYPIKPVEYYDPEPAEDVNFSKTKKPHSPNRRISLQVESKKLQLPLTRSSSLSSIMENRPPSGVSSTSFTRIQRLKNNTSRRYTIDTSRAKSNQFVVSMCAKKIGIVEYPEGRPDKRACDVYWHNVVLSDMNKIVTSPNSKVNKFPGMNELAKKISLTHAISSMQKLFPDEYAFYPKSWFLPAHFQDFQRYYNQAQLYEKNELWFIVKPDEGAQGTGIYLINNPNQIRDSNQKQLVQEYVADPLLMGDKLKFDFRVYGVIKSINPLSIYVAREGMARFCTEKYEKPDSSNFKNLYAHLTNYSLNKANEMYVHSNTLQDQTKGSKRLLSTVFHQLEARGVKTKRLWHDIKLILVKTTLAMLPEIMLHYEHHFYDSAGPQCFQIMGFDVLIREDGTPILLEVNAAPSLTADHIIPFPGRSLTEGGQRVRSIVDEVIKFPLVRDTLLLILGLLNEEYNSSIKGETKSLDDFQTIKQRRKPHLSEIFPTRYGAHSGHLLFLDKAMYIYMQFVQLRNNVNITSAGLKQFVRKCNLQDIIPISQIDEKVAEINYYFTGIRPTFGNVKNSGNGLPFHAFLMFLFFVAEKKFNLESDLLSKVQRLLSFCDMSLRHYGHVVVESLSFKMFKFEINKHTPASTLRIN